jgi:PTS system nitrogen regulatory IIA component
MITLESLFPPAHVLVLRPRDKAAALAELAKRAATLLGAASRPIADALVARESLGSTGIGAGIALPHARLDTPQPFALFARLERPIAWDAIDHAPVDLLFLLLSPDEPADQRLKILSMVTRRLRDRSLAAALRHAADELALQTLLVRDQGA